MQSVLREWSSNESNGLKPYMDPPPVGRCFFSAVIHRNSGLPQTVNKSVPGCERLRNAAFYTRTKRGVLNASIQTEAR